jgi:hypothetical protein
MPKEQLLTCSQLNVMAGLHLQPPGSRTFKGKNFTLFTLSQLENDIAALTVLVHRKLYTLASTIHRKQKRHRVEFLTHIPNFI